MRNPSKSSHSGLWSGPSDVAGFVCYIYPRVCGLCFDDTPGGLVVRALPRVTCLHLRGSRKLGRDVRLTSAGGLGAVKHVGWGLVSLLAPKFAEN